MRKTGCVVTDIAMLLNWFGHNITPGELNGYLSDITGRTPGSYLFNDGSFHDAYFPASGTYGQSDGVQGLPVRFRTQNIAGATNQAIIDQLQQTITRNGPVLLTVPSESSGPTTYPAVAHSILAYAVVGQSGSEKILIRDPGHVYASETPSSDLTLDDYVNYENNKFPANPLDPNHTYTWLSQGGRIKYAELVNTSTTPMGSMVGHSPIDFVITDPLGHRLGYDPVTGISYNEIPGSFYGRSQKEAAAEGFNEAPISGYSSIDAEMGQLSAGQYAVQVYGLDSGAWSIDLGVSDPNNIFSFGTNILGGVASAGSYELFTVTATAVPEPSAFALLGVGAVSLLGCAWRRRS
jgi:hypothetical protein